MANFTEKKYKFNNAVLCHRIWEADNAKGVLLVLHGMAEHGARYADFAEYIKSNDFNVIVVDHRQHGQSIAHDEYGIFGEHDTYEAILKDVDFAYRKAKEDYPDLEVFILGHSMGSIISRAYVQNYSPDIAGLILVGSPGKDIKGIKALKMLSKVQSVFSKKGRANFIGNNGFKGFNDRVENKRCDFDWLSVNEENVDKYLEDELCGYNYNAKFYYELGTMFEDVSKIEKMKNMTDARVMFIYGLEDPVGDFGVGTRKLADSYSELGKNIVCKEFANSRHEVLNDNEKLEAYKVVGEFLRSEEK